MRALIFCIKLEEIASFYPFGHRSRKKERKKRKEEGIFYLISGFCIVFTERDRTN
jgi:hypothetical protein